MNRNEISKSKSGAGELLEYSHPPRRVLQGAAFAWHAIIAGVLGFAALGIGVFFSFSFENLYPVLIAVGLTLAGAVMWDYAWKSYAAVLGVVTMLIPTALFLAFLYSELRKINS